MTLSLLIFLLCTPVAFTVVLLLFLVPSGTYIYTVLRASKVAASIEPGTVPRSKAESRKMEALAREKVKNGTVWTPFFVFLVIAFSLCLVSFVGALWAISSSQYDPYSVRLSCVKCIETL